MQNNTTIGVNKEFVIRMKRIQEELGCRPDRTWHQKSLYNYQEILEMALDLLEKDLAKRQEP